MEPGLRARGQTDEDNRADTATAHGTHPQPATSGDNLNVISSDDGRNFGGKITSGETSPYTPALAANNGQLFIAWTGNGANQLNAAVVDTDLSQGVALGISSKVVLGESSSAGPSGAGWRYRRCPPLLKVPMCNS